MTYLAFLGGLVLGGVIAHFILRPILVELLEDRDG